MNVFQRDNSFYGHHGKGGKFHFLGVDLASTCGKARMLLTDSPMDQNNVPAILRCKAKGCKEKWKPLDNSSNPK